MLFQRPELFQSAYTGVITEQERREFAGVAIPKGEPEERIKHIDIILEEWKDNLEIENDEERRDITQKAVDASPRLAN
jgi:hypothetical protein